MGILTALGLIALACSAQNATLAAVGDIRLNGPVGALIDKSPTAPITGLGDALKADIVFGNLECSITARGTKQPKTWNFRAPARNLTLLKKAGFTLVNIANNHTWDYGQTGFLDTLAALKKYKLPYIGGGRDLKEAEKLHVIKINDLKVGFLGYTSTFPEQAWAKANKPGVAYSHLGRLPENVRQAKQHCDVLIVSLHGGTEIAEYPNDIQKAFAHEAVDAGADLILEHHPHVLQPIEVYKGKPIFYSLGNFLFVSPSTATRTTIVLKAELSPGGVGAIELTAFETDGGRPYPSGEEGRARAYAALNRTGALEKYPERFRLAVASKAAN